MSLFIPNNNSERSKRLEVQRVTAIVTKFLSELDLITNNNDNTYNIIVTEITCQIPDCAPIETLIIIVSKHSKWANKILLPLVEVTEKDVTKSLINPDLLALLSDDNDQNESNIQPTQATELSTNHIYNDLQQIVAQLSDTSYYTTHSPVTLTLLDEIQHNIDIIRKTLNTSKPSDSSIEAAMPYIPPDNITPVFMIPKPLTASTSTTSNTLQPSPVINDNNVKANSSSSTHIAPSNIISSVVINTSTPTLSPAVMAVEQPINQNILLGNTPSRHNKGVRARGCPCCDPDNIDNIVDKMFLDAPP